MTLPGGTVTFLFTDIEGSTRLWEQLGSAMEPVVERHDRLLREVVEAHDGAVVKCLGDGMMAVFASADAGVAAAGDAQRSLAGADWEPLPALRVRMGLHTAEAVPVDGDYHAPGVNRAARLADAAHGGQVLVSSTTASLVTAEELGLESLGLHQLRDLSEAIEIHQLRAPGLAHDFPEPRSLDAVDHNLPAQRTTFVGRHDELEEIAALLGLHRLVTLTGLGGIGKTRLAVQVAAEVAGEHHTVRLVELAGRAADEDLFAAVRDVLPWPGPGRGADGADGLVATIGERSVLLVLDNCEHLLHDVVRLVDTCLSRCRALTVLATSREPLGVAGEHVRALGPLSVDGDGPEPPAAIRLFFDRARAAGGAHKLDDDAAAHVATICRSLDGIPLAVELAAARISHLTPAEIGSRIDARLGLLTARDRTTVARHRTLTAALDWSHDLLLPPEQALLRRSAVFAGPATLDALEAVTPGGDLDELEVLDLAAALVDRSLVVTEVDGGVTRHSLLETVRRYALERLGEAGEEADTRRAHARWCSEMLETAGGLMALGRAEQAEAVAALHWAAEVRDPMAVELAAGSWQWWEVTGRPAEGQRFLREVLSWTAPEPSLARSALLSGAAQLAFVAGDLIGAAVMHESNIAELETLGQPAQAARSRNSLGLAHLYRGDVATAEAMVTRALADFEEAGDVVGAAYARSSLGLAAAAAQRPEEAVTHLLESLRLLREQGRSRDAASVLTNLGNIVEDQGDLQRAHRFHEGALQLHEELGDARGAALSLNNLSILAQHRGDHDHALEFAERALATFEEIGDAPGAASTVNNLANFAAEVGQHRLALDRYRSAVERFRDLRDSRGTATSLANLADLAARCGETRLAWRCAIESIAMGRHASRSAEESAVATLRSVAERCGAEVPDLDGDLIAMDHAELDRLLEGLRAVEVPAVVGGAERPASHELTRREAQVARLVALGRTNGEIAAELFISERTVESHMGHIRTKLGIDSRTQLVRWALDHDVV